MKHLILALMLSFSTSVQAAQAVTFVEPSTKPTYFAAAPQFVPPATPTDMCVLFGSATKKITVVGIQVYANQTSTGANQYHLIKRSTANSGGGINTVTGVPQDSGWPAATASMVYYTTVNPTTGTSAGTIDVHRHVTPSSTSLQIPNFDLLQQFIIHYSPIVLRGTGEGVAVNFAGVALPSGLSIGCSFAWIEEPNNGQ